MKASSKLLTITAMILMILAILALIPQLKREYGWGGINHGDYVVSPPVELRPIPQTEYSYSPGELTYSNCSPQSPSCSTVPHPDLPPLSGEAYRNIQPGSALDTPANRLEMRMNISCTPLQQMNLRGICLKAFIAALNLVHNRELYNNHVLNAIHTDSPELAPLRKARDEYEERVAKEWQLLDELYPLPKE